MRSTTIAVLPDQRGGAGAQLRRRAAVRAGDRPQRGQQDRARRRGTPPTRSRRRRRPRRASAASSAPAANGREEEARRVHLADGEDHRRDQPDAPRRPYRADRTAGAASSGQQRAREVVGVERAQVLELLADADQLDRDAELVGDRQRDAALGRAVELGQDDAGDADRLAEQLAPGARRSGRSWRRSVSSVSCGASGICLAITRRTLASSSIRSSCVCRRPAVSTITTSAPRSRPRATASKATAPGSEPSGALDDVDAGALAPSARAARRRRRGTCRPRRSRRCGRASLRRCQASLPIVVVLPVPLTPTTRITVGLGAQVDRGRRRCGRARRAARPGGRSAPRRRRARRPRPRARAARRPRRWSRAPTSA